MITGCQFKDKDSLRSIKETIQNRGKKAGIDLSVSFNQDLRHGILSTSSALKSQNPKDSADQIVSLFSDHQFIYASATERGFVNFGLKPEAIHAGLKEILAQSQWYGQPSCNIRISVDHTDVNPTGLPHIGHARLAIVGDVLCRFLSWCGATVHRDYILNDAGSQIKALVGSVHARQAELNNQKASIPEDGYHGEYIIEVAKNCPEGAGAPEIVDYIMQDILKDLGALGVDFDEITSEREMQVSGAVDKAIQCISENTRYGTLPPPKDADPDWVPGENLLMVMSDESAAVLKKSNGSWTYLAGDVAFHKKRIDRGAELLINVFGADHDAHIPKIQRCVDLLSTSLSKEVSVEFVTCQMVGLIKNGQSFRMSKRSGNYLTMRELIGDVEPDILRIAMLTRNSKSPIDIHVDQLQTMSQDNPYYYIQYAYARTHSVLRAAKAEQNHETSDLSRLEHELDHVVRLMHWPMQVESVLHNLQSVHYLVEYAHQISNSFHSLWSSGDSHPMKRFIVASDPELTRARLAVVRATQIVLENIMTILGVTPLKQLGQAPATTENHKNDMIP